MNRRLEVLLVEDDPADAELTRRTLEHGKLLVNLQTVTDGVKAMAYLRRESPYFDAVRPDLVLLDLNMPRKDGREVLREMKSDADLKAIPVVIVTTSSADEDIVKTYGLGCNCYVTKPIGLEQFSQMVRSIEEFWFSIVKLPPR
jgi:CheY-like chemotaxis protein